MKKTEIASIVLSQPRSHEMGYTWMEIEHIKHLIGMPIDEASFNEALTGITCMQDSYGNMIIYPRDVINAISAGIEKRTLTNLEWD